jgi:hypothetical protein
MIDSTAPDYPPGVPERRPRPKPLDAAAGLTPGGALALAAAAGVVGVLLSAIMSRFSLKDAVEHPFHAQWTKAALDDWLYGDLVDFQLPQKIAQIQSGSNE